MSRRLEVLLHDRLVGHLSDLPEGGTEFRLTDSYRELVPRPVLGQKFEDDLEKIHRSRKGQGLPDFFANLIPEGRLRQVIEEAAAIETGDDLALLSFVGADLPGAVEVRPVAEDGTDSSLTRSREPAASDEQEAEVGDLLRFSLAGVQLKFSMLLEDEKLTLPARDRTGEWIVKFDSPTFPKLPENEFAMLEWARFAGFDVPEARLHDVGDVVGFPRQFARAGSRVLAIRRYDRSQAGRIHQEDFAQAVGLPPMRKYDQITYEAMARLVRRFIDEAAVDEMVRRLVFVLASGNNDAHLKNWSLVYPDKINANWSPLYDQAGTVAWELPGRSLALKLAGVKDFSQLDRGSLERFADKAELDAQRVVELVDETLMRLRASWSEARADWPLPEDHAGALREHWRNMPLLRSAGGLP